VSVKVLKIELGEVGAIAKLLSRAIPGDTKASVVLGASLLLGTYAAKRNGIPIEVYIELAKQLWDETEDPSKAPEPNVPASGGVH
jgi:hypothetical protein